MSSKVKNVAKATEYENEGFSKNKMTCRELLKSQEANLQFFPSKKRPGHIYFACGKIESGYVSPAAEKLIKDAKYKPSYDDLKYCEFSTNGENYVPCLMVTTNDRKAIGELDWRNA